MRLFPRHEQPDSEVLAAFHLSEQETEQQDEQQIPWHCAWCQPYIDGATSGICAECEALYFPKRGAQ